MNRAKNKRSNNKKKKRSLATHVNPISAAAAPNAPQNGLPQRPRSRRRARSDDGISGGLDIARETPEQVETMVQFFPDQLKNDRSHSGGGIRAPDINTPTIYHQLYKNDGQTLNLKAIPCIPVMAGVGAETTEFGF